MKNTVYSLFSLFLAALLFVGCDSNVMDSDHAVASLRVQPLFDGQQLVAGQTYDHNGTAINFGTARVYLSEIVLIKQDGTEVSFEGDTFAVPAKSEAGDDVTLTVSDKVILAKHDLGQDEYQLGEATSGSYKGIRFKVGIDGANNRIDASQVPATNPLAKQTDKNNHWSWANGYIYLRMDGQVDSDGDGTPDTAWETHIGKTSFLKTVQLDTNFDLDADNNLIHITVDYHKFLHMVDLSDPGQRLCHTGDNLPVANKVGGMIAGAFEFHGLHMSEEHAH